MASKKFNPAILLLFIIPAFFIFAIIVYLSTSDGLLNGRQISGWEALQMEWPSFWIWIAICSTFGIIFAILAWGTEKRGGKPGKVILYTILALVLLCAPWGKGCTDKTNGGVTSGGYTPTPAR